MASIRDSKGTSGEGFARLFGNESLGKLFSKVQATTIRGGFELEELLVHLIPPEMVTTLNILASEIEVDFHQKPTRQVVFKPTKMDPDNPQKSIQADLLIIDNRERRFLLVEIKEGYVFDTKKADGELESLRKITSWLAQEFAYKTHYYLCSFNQDNKNLIVSGAKKRFDLNHVMTGRELCEVLGLDYNHLLDIRKKFQQDNLKYFLEELLKISEIREQVMQIIKSTGE